jgi:hypothetical protein
MAGNLFPLLLIGGAAAFVLTSSKKKGGPGFRILGDCEGIEVYDGAASMSFTTRWFLENAGNTVESAEADIANFYTSIFPDCQWPPEDPESFMVSGVSYAARLRAYIDLKKGEAGEIDASSATGVGSILVGPANGRSFSGGGMYVTFPNKPKGSLRRRGFNGVSGLAGRPGAAAGSGGGDVIAGENAGPLRSRRRRSFSGKPLEIGPCLPDHKGGTTCGPDSATASLGYATAPRRRRARRRRSLRKPRGFKGIWQTVIELPDDYSKPRARRRRFAGGVEEITVTSDSSTASGFGPRMWRKSRGRN